MAERETVVLEWTMVNWITVVLMVVLGFAIIGTVRAFALTNLKKAQSGQA